MVRQGILKAGGAFLSIAPDYPDERVRVMVEDSGSAVLIVTEALLEERKEGWRVEDLRELEPIVVPLTGAKVIYTHIRGSIDHL